MERQTTFVLAFVTGFVDTVGFITLSGLFIAQITGNLVLVGASFIKADDASNINRLLMLPVYLLGSSIVTLLDLLLSRTSKTVFPILLLVEAGLLLLFTGLGYFLGTQHHPLEAIDTFFIATAGVLAMAVQSSAVRLGFPAYVSTTTMTINLTQFSIDLVDYLAAVLPVTRRSQTPDQQLIMAQNVNRYGVALLGFLFGTGAGALLFAQIGAVASLLPVGLVVWIAVAAQRASSAGPVATQ